MWKLTNISVKILFGGLFFLCQTVFGQDNPYKIDNQLYTYYQRCNSIIKNPKVMLMADTLFQRAAQKGDVKAQCLAKNLKADHYYFTDNIRALLAEHKEVADFARNTPYKQYIFGSWNRIITYYLRNREYETALQELKKYQDEAIRLNEPYGIGQSYVRMGDVYFQQEMSNIAIKQYMQAADYYKSVGKENELYHPYYTIGNCYTNLSEYDKAEKYILKSIELAPNLQAKMNSTLGLFRIYLQTQKFDKAKRIKDELTEYNAKGMLKTGLKQNYYSIIASYYRATNGFDQSLQYSDSIKDKLVKYGHRYRTYAQMGDFQKAFAYLKKENQIRDSLSRINNSEMLASYNARFNNQKLELEKNRLSLQNTEMQLKQILDREQLILMEKERTRIELENRDLQLEQQRTSTELEKAEAQKQRLEVMHKKEELRRIRMEKEASQHQTVVIISILLLITLFSIIYAITRRQNTQRLQKEKEAAEKARRQAEKADKLKSAFLQNLSHEIRTPLNAIVGFNDLLNDTMAEFSQEEREELLSHLHKNTELLLTLVNDVLDLSKLESGNYSISLRKVVLPELCQATLAGITHRVAEGVQLNLKQPEEETIIVTDAQRLQQILTNLLVNACKYTRQGNITLAYKTDAENIVFSVTDTGSGIDKDKSEQIFQRFEKLDTINPGFGLGLSICRSLATLLGGKIYLDTNYTGGSRFILELPLQPPV